MGQTEHVLTVLDEIKQLSVETHQQMFMPDLHRLRAEALRRVDTDGQRIEEEYRLALQLAHEQGALALELRAAMGLTHWLAETNRRKQGCELLQEVHGRLTEGFGTSDLGEATALLETLE